MLVHLEFGGGLELLFEGRKKVEAELPDKNMTVGELVVWVRQHLIHERHDMFTHGNEIRPGVLVLINDVDWELEGKSSYELEAGDVVTFISTLHGG